MVWAVVYFFIHNAFYSILSDIPKESIANMSLHPKKTISEKESM